MYYIFVNKHSIYRLFNPMFNNISLSRDFRALDTEKQ